MKVVINRCFGGFGLSPAAYKELGLEWDGFGFAYDKDRANPALVNVVEKLGEKANGAYADLCIVEIPPRVKWEITDYDGYEQVEEVHRTWP